jgi:RHS repeat-associated protein
LGQGVSPRAPAIAGRPRRFAGPVPPGRLIRAAGRAIDLRDTLPASTVCWAFDEAAQRWLASAQLPSLAEHRSAGFVRPGDCLFVRDDESVEIPPPDPSLEILYYHQDHLGSSAVITDREGRVVEETASYPFGEIRHAHRPRKVSDPYQFIQKEQDEESGLRYFEARYLAGENARFLSPDPLYLVPHALSTTRFEAMLQNPQSLNLYAYAQNNPIKYRDPTGLDIEGLIDDIQRAVGLKAQLIDTAKVAERQAEMLGAARKAVRDAYDDANMERIVLSGHGDYPFNDPRGELSQATRDMIRDRPQYIEVPEGTTITFYATHGMTISDPLGNAIESNTVPYKQYSETYGPGELVPNYRLSPPTGLHIKYRLGDGNVTVDSPTMLEDLLKPNMGPVDWAACLYDRQFGKEPPTADLKEEGAMILHKAGQDPAR